MKEEEKKIFWKLDDKLYLVDKNNTYKKIFKSFIKYNNDIVQDFINKLIAWYFVKYSDSYIELVMNKKFDRVDYSLINIMSFDKLRYRIDDMIHITSDDDNLCYQYLIMMAGWGLIYDKNSNPKFGLFRVNEMFREFNSCYGWRLNTNVYESIIEVDYSLKNPAILKLLEKKDKNNENYIKKNKLPKIKKLFRG